MASIEQICYEGIFPNITRVVDSKFTGELDENWIKRVGIYHGTADSCSDPRGFIVKYPGCNGKKMVSPFGILTKLVGFESFRMHAKMMQWEIPPNIDRVDSFLVVVDEDGRELYSEYFRIMPENFTGSPPYTSEKKFSPLIYTGGKTVYIICDDDRLGLGCFDTGEVSPTGVKLKTCSCYAEGIYPVIFDMKFTTAPIVPTPQTKWCELEGRNIPETEWTESRCVPPPPPPEMKWCAKEGKHISEAEWSEERCLIEKPPAPEIPIIPIAVISVAGIGILGYFLLRR